ncbi:MAG: hypothetical protein P9L89_00790 [Candidatus Celaenobacter polaris]|nr:hypothetical protein [Candidatus Celaenobacter polaris]
MKNEILHKEIDLIQSCIKRMANNSFIIKGWTISLIVIVLSLSLKVYVNLILLSFILLFTVLAFWFLDSFFLQTEKKYRKMHEWVIKNRENSNEYLYDLNPARFNKEVSCRFRIMMSVTLWPFYLIPSLILIFIILNEFFWIL